MTIYRRRLPHVYETQNPVFLTWRLHGSLPANRPFHGGSITSGKAFVTLDRLLDEQSIGPLHLRHPAIADLVVEAIHHNGEALHHYQLHAYAIMPNHVHLLLTPAIPLPRLTRSLKGITAKRANEILALTGTPFWQEETYDREVRDQPELDRIRSYIETNPVHAGLVLDAAQYRWSSAGQDQSRQASRAA